MTQEEYDIQLKIFFSAQSIDLFIKIYLKLWKLLLYFSSKAVKCGTVNDVSGFKYVVQSNKRNTNSNVVFLCLKFYEIKLIFKHSKAKYFRSSGCTYKPCTKKFPGSLKFSGNSF
jgi:hypothetical protein